MKHAVKVFAFLFICLVVPAVCAGRGNERIDYWMDAWNHFDNIYHDHMETLYCGFPYSSGHAVSLPDGFIITSHYDRAHGMERAFVVPVENFGRAFRAWREGSHRCVRSDGTPYRGRDCAEKASRRFRLMYCDLHNVFPSVGSVNSKRSNHEFEQVGESAKMPFGPTCPMKFEGRVFSDGGKTHRSVVVEPPDRAKGIVARACRYMDWAYPEYRMSVKRRRIMEMWDAQFPPDEWECERNRRIKLVQGNGNPFVEAKCGGKEVAEPSVSALPSPPEN